MDQKPGAALPQPFAVVGAGRMGRAIVATLRAAGTPVSGPHRRGYSGQGDAAVLLCVPDDAIAAAAAAITPGPLVGHSSGACDLDVLGAHRAFSVHPMMTATQHGADFAGAWSAVDGSDEQAVAAGESLVRLLGMQSMRVVGADRAAYHAAAAIASNYLVTLEWMAAQVIGTVGLDHEVLVPIARASFENWVRMGPAALTGPVARGDEGTVARHRAAVVERVPELVPLLDELVAATRRLAAQSALPEPIPLVRRDARHLAEDEAEPPITMVRSVAELRGLLGGYRRTRSVGLVPTMGALHEGHLSLARRARSENDVVVMSIFVNPIQFNDSSDLAAYPRDEETDIAMARSAGVDVIFAPGVEEVYPAGFSTSVALRGPLVNGLEGAHRGVGHFHGVTTVVAKLFGMVQPHRAYFGQKDGQQARVVQTMVTDLDLPVQIVVVPTVREPDGLAMSSRNRRLGPADRARAAALYAALHTAHQLVVGGTGNGAALLAAAREVLSDNEIDVEYLELVDAVTFLPIEDVGDGAAVMVVAATIGGTRLIDNVLLTPGST